MKKLVQVREKFSDRQKPSDKYLNASYVCFATLFSSRFVFVFFFSDQPRVFSVFSLRKMFELPQRLMRIILIELRTPNFSLFACVMSGLRRKQCYAAGVFDTSQLQFGSHGSKQISQVEFSAIFIKYQKRFIL